MLADRRIEHSHARLARHAPSREIPQRQGAAVKIGHLRAREIVGIGLFVAAKDERLHRVAFRRRDLVAHHRDDRREAFVRRLFLGCRHCVTLLQSWPPRKQASAASAAQQ